MENEFKEIITKIIGDGIDINTVELSKKERHERKVFLDLIEQMEILNDREELFTIAGIDLETVISPYEVIIEDLIDLLYGKQMKSLIYTYVYDKPKDENEAIVYKVSEDFMFPIETPLAMWDVWKRFLEPQHKGISDKKNGRKKKNTV